MHLSFRPWVSDLKGSPQFGAPSGEPHGEVADDAATGWGGHGGHSGPEGGRSTDAKADGL